MTGAVATDELVREDDATPTLTGIPVVTEVPEWFAELKPAPKPGRVRPCPHCRRRQRKTAAAAILAAAVLAAGLFLAFAIVRTASPGLPAGTAAAVIAPARAAPAPARAVPVPVRAVVTVAPGDGVPHPRLLSFRHSAHQRHARYLALLAARKAAAAAAAAIAPVPARAVSVVTRLPSAPAPAAAVTPAHTPAPAPAHTQAPVQTPAPAPVAAGSSLGASLLAEAEKMQGVPYVYGGDTPAGVDCSGLVYWAAGQLGITLPRDTFAMLAGSAHLESVQIPEPGDLAFFGTGHVELYVSPGRFFGAQQTGTLTGFHDYGGYYAPTEYFRLI